MIGLLAAAAIAAPAFEARILWVDATANLSWTIDPVKVHNFCLKAKAAGFNELVVDVKPINGKQLFAATPDEKFSSFRDIVMPPDYDLLAVFAKEAHGAGLRISADINALSEGHTYFPGVGKAYENPDWETKVAVPEYFAVLSDGRRIPIILDPTTKLGPGQIKIADGDGTALPDSTAKVVLADDLAGSQIDRVESKMEIVGQTAAFPKMVAVFVDPLSAGVHDRLTDIVRRAAAYNIDGIVFDRLRYSALTSGMGDSMRAEFERRYGPVGAWPESIFYSAKEPRSDPLHGPRFAEWMQFRSEIIAEYLRDLRNVIKTVNPKLTVGSYVGAGWETYYEVGVNFATDEAEPPYPWALDEYGLAGYAGYLDFLMPGCFYKVAREVDPGVQPGRSRFTVEGGAKLTTGLAGDSTFVYPALYGLDWEGNPDGLRKAIETCRRIGRGIMIFDAVYVIKNDWWDLFAKEFANAPPQPPHAMPSLTRHTSTRS
ncbi:MAG TPA: alpha amylase family protein [Fimbriimonadales bacterium]|jgi:uncharacterized lipoprotein YddW (UPF0748 family)|nr:alpha amylase family protein [Fimbriimonadales bacterium]